MTDRVMGEKVASISESLVLAEVSDPASLADIHTGFEEIAAWAESADQPEVAAAVASAVTTLEQIILGETDDPAAAMDTIGAIFSAVQSVVCEGRAASEVEFPDTETSSDASSDGQVSTPTDITLPSYIDETIFSDFLNKQSGSLEEMESFILDFERTRDKEKVGAVRRLIHTLKGESALLGLTDVETLCHETEDIMNAEPAGLTDVLLGVKDWLARTFDHMAGKGDSPGPAAGLLERLAGEPPSDADTDTVATASGEDEFDDTPVHLEGDPELLADFVVEAMEHLDAADTHLLTIETAPEDEDAINAVFRGFHTIKGVAGFLALDDIGELAHQSENLLDKARKGEMVLEGPAVDVTFDAVDMLKRMIEHVRKALAAGGAMEREPALSGLLARIKAVSEGRVPEGSDAVAAAPPKSKLGEILVNTGGATKEDVEAALDEQGETEERPKLGEQLVQDKKVAPKDVARALRSQKPATGKKAVHVRETVKVDADRLDLMVDAIGEMVIAESMVSQSPELQDIKSHHLIRQLGLLDKITRELQEMAMSLRMVPVCGTFQRMARLVRDLSKKSGKKVEFVMNGEDTELDKTVVDRIGDPLVHMVRNAVDHGLEATAEDRESAGKRPAGRVELRAFHKGGNIHIEIEDDGRGLDRDVILAKGIERGLVKEGDNLTDREVFGLIFQPGFSTAKTVTNVSGRGVGMDVVRKNIEALRGRVEIESTPGKGSVFSIRLPLTLAIIDGMVVRSGDERYIIPTLSIVMSMRPETKDISSVLDKGEMLKLQGELLPLFRLNKVFNVDDAIQDATDALVVVVEADGRKVGLVTDELLGQQQIVIKSLGESMQGLAGISGGAIMPDGRVGLILDIGGLVKLANTDGGEVPASPNN